MAEVKKAREPVYSPNLGSEFPRMLYNKDRTFVVVHSAAEMADKMADNKGKDAVWATSPSQFGVVTHPQAVEVEQGPGKW
jgi:hypothetical protein